MQESIDIVTRGGAPKVFARAGRPEITLSDVEFAYAEGAHRHVLFNALSFTFAGARSVAILGRSGAGKSTLLNLIAGLDRPTRGRILVDGVELTRLSDRQLTLYRRSQIGIVFQFFNLIPTLSVRDNLRLPLELNGLPAARRDARVDACLEWVGLSGLGARFPEELSGGEQQRVAVARAIVHEPKLVLADEPTGSLDAGSAARTLSLLLRAAATGGHTLLLVTHSSEVAAQAERIVVLEEGALCEGRGEGAA